MDNQQAPAGAGRLAGAILGTFVIMFVAPLLTYVPLAALGFLEQPAEAEGTSFMLGVLVMKIGIAFGFVGIFHAGRSALAARWLAYAGIWWLMYCIIEIGQAIAPGYSWIEALAGIVAEAIYFPASAWIARRILSQR